MRKAKVLCVCLNPAIDKCVFIEHLKVNEINRIDSKSTTMSAGGKAINVAKVITQLGHKAEVVGFVAGENGQFIKSQLNRMNIPCEFVHVNGNTRMNTNILDSASGQQTELLESGPDISPDQVCQFMEMFKKHLHEAEFVVLSGSLPKNISQDIYAELTQIAHDGGVKIVLDTTGQPLVFALENGVDLWKPNLAELSQLVSADVCNFEMNCKSDIISQIKNLILKFDVKKILVSLGCNGAIFVSNQGEVLTFDCEDIPVENAVGSGDSMVAGFLVGMIENESNVSAFALGMACAQSNVKYREVAKINVDDVIKLKHKLLEK